MFVRGLRGAVTVESNTRESILANTTELLSQLLIRNNIKDEDLISIVFTMSPDLNAAFPAEAARKLGLNDIALICMNELSVKGAIEKCVRILIHFNTEKTNKDLKHVYLKGAAALRPDLSKEES